jgi:uncharacterized protein
MGRLIARFSMKYRWWVFGLTALIALLMGLMIPRISIDTDPENMLPVDQADRIEHNRIKELFDLYDMIVVGVVNRDHPRRIYNPESLAALFELTRGIEQIDGCGRARHDVAGHGRQRRAGRAGHAQLRLAAG